MILVGFPVFPVSFGMSSPLLEGERKTLNSDRFCSDPEGSMKGSSSTVLEGRGGHGCWPVPFFELFAVASKGNQGKPTMLGSVTRVL